jgi:hypothetical protein
MPSNGPSAASPSVAGHNNRLDSWKEIAGYLHRSVRTVQRWEEELGLPVHRLAGKKRDIVYAYPAELDTWLREHSDLVAQEAVELEDGDTEASAPPDVAPVASQPAVTRELAAQPRRISVAMRWAVVVLVIAVGLGWMVVAGRRPQMADVGSQGRDLVAMDASGKEIWRHRFDFALSPELRNPINLEAPDFRRFAIADVNGDGQAEMLIAAQLLETNRPTDLYCFSARGKLLWRYAHERPIQYGQGTFAPPFNFVSFLITPSNRPGEQHIWAVSSHLPEFPTVVAKLDSQGRVLAEFWHPGHISVLAEAALDGQRVMLVGATHNEFFSGTLSVLDYENPQGRAPATNSEYVCLDCPAGSPLGFVLFPRSPLTRALDNRASVRGISQRASGQVEVKVESGSIEGPIRAVETYKLDSGFRLTSAEVTEGYAMVHSALLLKSLLKKPLDRKKEAMTLLSGVRYWDGKQFVLYAKPDEVKAEVSVAHALRPKSVFLRK